MSVVGRDLPLDASLRSVSKGKGSGHSDGSLLGKCRPKVVNDCPDHQPQQKSWCVSTAPETMPDGCMMLGLCI
jgi:hypothetical protein